MSVPPDHRRRLALVALAVALALSGCSTAEFYWQGIVGHLDLMRRAQPIDEVLDRSDDQRLKERLTRVREIRAFASRELSLPANGTFTRYSDLGRPFVTWNVFAAPPLSLEPRTWCFPVAGCVSYRGYFDEASARAEAERLRAAGDDVFVSGVPAYSTLGWFDDPVLSSFVRYPDTELARLLFHELAHQVAYVKDDTVFNESFAVAVEEEGVRRWLRAQTDPAEAARLGAELGRAQTLRREFRRLVRQAREQLSALYASDASPDAKAAAKREVFAAMRAAYENAKAGEPGLAGYDRWFAGYAGGGPNNASLAAIGLYTEKVPVFRAMLGESGGDLSVFYRRVKELARKPKAERLLDERE